MASLSLHIPPEREITPTFVTLPTTGAAIVASFGDAMASEYAAFARSENRSRITTVDLTKTFEPSVDWFDATSLVLFIKLKLTGSERLTIERLLTNAKKIGVKSVCVISSFGVHLGDREAETAEHFVRSTARRIGLRAIVIRHSHVISELSPTVAALRTWGAFFPLVPSRMRGCFLSSTALFSAIESELKSENTRRRRVCTLFGMNRPWRDALAEHRSTGPLASCVVAVCLILSWLQVGRIAALFVDFLIRRNRAPGCWNVQTLRPRTYRELRALYNAYSYRDVKLVGYNNGVNHFGQRFPGRTVVSTVHLNRVVRHGPDSIRADGGATIRKVRDFLAGQGHDLFVVPNYSYVCLGTAFFVPIHGSASDYSCVAETITRAVLYDPIADRLLVADSESDDFRRFAYDTTANVLLLRLYCRVKPRASYFMRTEEVCSPTATDLLAALTDQRASNVEVRKSQSKPGSPVKILRFYKHAGDAGQSVLEVPRDSIGRLWDRLEENPVTSFLMHALTRHLAWHVELFFTEQQFHAFWETHAELKVKKIQLRYIRRDGLPHSPFRDEPCVSSDMFMLRKHRASFEEYVKRTLPGVRSNPGKHSM